MARAQGLSEVLNPKYIPHTSTASYLFWEKQKFLYAILEAKVHYPTPSSAMFAANKIMEYLMTICINDGSWHGSLENFLIIWQEQLRRYEPLVPSASHYKDEQKLAMLQFTVYPLRELRQVKNTALLIKQANSGKDLTYDEYVQLLAHAASDYNNVQIKAKGKGQVYLHEVNEDTLDTYEEVASDYEPFAIDTPVETIQVYASIP
jgi:hypothetical protein